MTADRHLTAEESLSRAQRRRLFTRVLVRSLVTAAGLVALYYVAPLDNLQDIPVLVSVCAGLAILLIVAVVQVRVIASSRYPAIRAVQALAAMVPLFLVLFASAYIVLAQDDPANFSSHELTKTDSLYFTVTTFSTVGFGDITATSQTARILVTTQMVLDLVVLGLGVQVYRGAVNIGRRRTQKLAAGTEARDGTDGDQP